MDAVLCRMPVGNNTMCAWHICCGAPILNQCPYWSPTYMTLLVILVHTQYILVCTCLYYSTFPVPVCTRSILVRTDSETVRTKYPVPVMRVTIPDVLLQEALLQPLSRGRPLPRRSASCSCLSWAWSCWRARGAPSLNQDGTVTAASMAVWHNWKNPGFTTIFLWVSPAHKFAPFSHSIIHSV